MIFAPKETVLKDGTRCVLRSPSPSDAEAMIEYLKTCAAETDFILRYPEECDITPENERSFIEGVNSSDLNIMIACEIEGDIAGTCHLFLNSKIKTKHRASVAIALKRRYWGKGLGAAMLGELFSVAREKGVSQLELDYIEGNARARALYEKLGFTITAKRPDAIRLKDGTMLAEFSMVKKL